MLLSRYALPVPDKMGAGGYKPWVEATKTESLWLPGKTFPEAAFELEIVLHPEEDLDAIAMLAWTEKLLRDAKVITAKHRLLGASVFRDSKGEIMKSRVRVTLWA